MSDVSRDFLVFVSADRFFSLLFFTGDPLEDRLRVWDLTLCFEELLFLAGDVDLFRSLLDLGRILPDLSELYESDDIDFLCLFFFSDGEAERDLELEWLKEYFLERDLSERLRDLCFFVTTS